MKQLSLLAREKSKYRAAYGGDLMTTREGRSKPRPLSTKETMHLVLRSSKAKGEFSFRFGKNAKIVMKTVKKFAAKYGVQILSMANVGNHLHLQIKLGNRFAYAPFIRAITGAIAWHVMGKVKPGRFWDRRPFTRIVVSLKAFLNLKDYIAINQLEAQGVAREYARTLVRYEKSGGA